MLINQDKNFTQSKSSIIYATKRDFSNKMKPTKDDKKTTNGLETLGGKDGLKNPKKDDNTPNLRSKFNLYLLKGPFSKFQKMPKFFTSAYSKIKNAFFSVKRVISSSKTLQCVLAILITTLAYYFQDIIIKTLIWHLMIIQDPNDFYYTWKKFLKPIIVTVVLTILTPLKGIEDAEKLVTKVFSFKKHKKIKNPSDQNNKKEKLQQMKKLYMSTSAADRANSSENKNLCASYRELIAERIKKAKNEEVSSKNPISINEKVDNSEQSARLAKWNQKSSALSGKDLIKETSKRKNTPQNWANSRKASNLSTNTSDITKSKLASKGTQNKRGGLIKLNNKKINVGNDININNMKKVSGNSNKGKGFKILKIQKKTK